MSGQVIARVRVPKHVVFRPFGDEMVLLNLQTGQYHGLNRSGGRMVEVLAEVGDLEVAVRRIAEEFSVAEDDVRRDMTELCADLADRSLVELESASSSRAEPAAGAEGE